MAEDLFRGGHRTKRFLRKKNLKIAWNEEKKKRNSSKNEPILLAENDCSYPAIPDCCTSSNQSPFHFSNEKYF